MSNLYQKLPETPGVYLMKGSGDKLLYIGKAANLRRRVSSYFARPHDIRLEKLVSEIKKIDYQKTETALEALILESALIKKHQPPFNVREKDDKSFLFVEITKEKFPRVLLARGKGLALSRAEVFGPFTSASNIREALRIIRRIFPFSTHPAETLGKFKRPCFDYDLGLCPGTCVGIIERKDYLKNIRRLVLLFEGKKKRILKELEAEMKTASRQMEFERAEKLKRQVFALQHIQDTALISEEKHELGIRNYGFRIEGYDISNISGISATGSMVVFLGDKPDRNQYRKFKIGSVSGPNDTAMLKEVLSRRLNHREWPLPALFLIDGGKGQVNAARSVLDEFGLKIPVVGIAKGAKRKKNEFIGEIPSGIAENTLIRVRNEAHRFAISYHKNLRSKNSLINK